ncbi:MULTISPECIES: hypothetical protein [Thermomonospora]|uniref:Uncharacterized protein n=1 Tax=Thermomonospora curvata (strain ATCC 19995 / DSM 43183 / JCM 3096 / KCTC 9072 / NBRC 15933 / NCIMB 10081 / Henssen B9) TaxID=471852 RepID=D1ACZ7_THECD|nr:MULTISPECIES: hypothetical protein [Thermomonospora]ACY99306.1 hypothetical protein Tcur_3773 [Thermomonospora curvata DSM 43183]
MRIVPPWNDQSYAPCGPEDIFQEADVKVMISVLHQVRSTAVPPESAAARPESAAG